MRNLRIKIAKWWPQILIQICIILIAKSLFLDCTNFFAEETDLFVVDLSICSRNWEVFWLVILLSFAIFIILKKAKEVR